MQVVPAMIEPARCRAIVSQAMRVAIRSRYESDGTVIGLETPAGSASAEQPWGARAAIQFFLGGAVLFLAALTLIGASTSAYDGVVSLLAYGVMAVVIAVVSMIGAFAAGLPMRLVAKLRSRWLANGELTMAGAVIGFSACCLLMAFAPVTIVTDELGSYQVREPIGWALIAAWALFAFSVAHFVWPRRWRRS